MIDRFYTDDGFEIDEYKISHKFGGDEEVLVDLSAPSEELSETVLYGVKINPASYFCGMKLEVVYASESETENELYASILPEGRADISIDVRNDDYSELIHEEDYG